MSSGINMNARTQGFSADCNEMINATDITSGLVVADW